MRRGKAVVLLSGGLDSATVLYWARARGLKVFGLAINYGQRHSRELAAAARLAKRAKTSLYEISLSLPWLGSNALTNRGKRLPDTPLARIGMGGVPSTYVPGRNTVFLALGASLADAIGADAVAIGANALDFSGYPDCRPDFLAAFEKAAQLGTRRRIRVLAPLARKNKKDIIRLASELSVPLELTWSCYQGGRRPCGRCDSCKLRARGFAEAGASDPALAP